MSNRTRMMASELAALMDNFNEDVPEVHDEECAQVVKMFNLNKEHEWELTTKKVAILGMVLANLCKEIIGSINNQFIVDRIEATLNVLLLPQSLWHQIYLEFGADPGIFPNAEAKTALEKKFGAISWERAVNGETIQPEGDLGDKWK